MKTNLNTKKSLVSKKFWKLESSSLKKCQFEVHLKLMKDLIKQYFWFDWNKLSESSSKAPKLKLFSKPLKLFNYFKFWLPCFIIFKLLRLFKKTPLWIWLKIVKIALLIKMPENFHPIFNSTQAIKLQSRIWSHKFDTHCFTILILCFISHKQKHTRIK